MYLRQLAWWAAFLAFSIWLAWAVENPPAWLDVLFAWLSIPFVWMDRAGAPLLLLVVLFSSALCVLVWKRRWE